MLTSVLLEDTTVTEMLIVLIQEDLLCVPVEMGLKEMEQYAQVMHQFRE